MHTHEIRDVLHLDQLLQAHPHATPDGRHGLIAELIEWKNGVPAQPSPAPTAPAPAPATKQRKAKPAPEPEPEPNIPEPEPEPPDNDF